MFGLMSQHFHSQKLQTTHLIIWFFGPWIFTTSYSHPSSGCKLWSISFDPGPHHPAYSPNLAQLLWSSFSNQSACPAGLFHGPATSLTHWRWSTLPSSQPIREARPIPASSLAAHQPNFSTYAPCSRVTTRSQRGIFKPNPRYNHHTLSSSTTSISPIPQNPVGALTDPNWKYSMQDEYNICSHWK